MREVLHELAVVDDRLDHLVHVVGQVRRRRQQVAQLGAQPLGVVVALDGRRLLHVVLRQERQQVAHVVEARLLVGRHERGDARLRGVAHRPAELLERDVLAGHRLHDVGAGDEHVRRLADHEDEVGHRRRVDGAAGARAEDHRDLRHDARRQHVAVEDAAVAGERDDALLDAGAGAVVEPDDRRADLEGEVHQLVDLLGEHLAERAAEHREVLREHEHLAALDRAPAGDDAVGVGTLLEARRRRAVAGEEVELVERAVVEEVLDALAGEQLALGVLALDRAGRAGVVRLLAPLLQIVELLLHAVPGHRVRDDATVRPARCDRTMVRRSKIARPPRHCRAEAPRRSAGEVGTSSGASYGTRWPTSGQLDVAGARHELGDAHPVADRDQRVLAAVDDRRRDREAAQPARRPTTRRWRGPGRARRTAASAGGRWTPPSRRSRRGARRRTRGR